MDINVHHYFHTDGGGYASLFAGLTQSITELKELTMSAAEDVLREVQEQRLLNQQTMAAISALVSVVNPLAASLEQYKAALTQAQADLAAAGAASAATDAAMAAAAAQIDADQIALADAIAAASAVIPPDPPEPAPVDPNAPL